MENFTLDLDAAGVAIVTFDVPGRSMNTITQGVQRDLDTLARRIADDPAIVGAVLRSGKPSGFCAGADLVEMTGEMQGWRDAEGQDALRAGVDGAGAYGRRLRALETCGKPVAAAIEGLALGGGLELALACTLRIGVDDPAPRLALPEATIGLMPGAGATQRLPRLMGLQASLPHLLEGKPIATGDALRGRVLTAIAPAGEVVARCRAAVLGATDAVAPWDAKGFKLPGGGPHGEAGHRDFPLAIARLVGTHGPNYPARANILRAVYEGSLVPIDAGLRIESRYFFNTVRSAQARAMIGTLFTARQALGRRSGDDGGDYVGRLTKAWQAAADAAVAAGEPASLVIGAARIVGGWRPDVPALADRHLDLVDGARLALIGERLLTATAREAERCVAEGVVAGDDAADVIAVEAGFPAWTGGPISYLRQRGTAA